MRDSTTYKIAGPKTFRLGSTMILSKKQELNGKIIKKGWGGNLQNKEKGERVRYIPDEGYKFGQRDQSGAEALAVAYLCESGNFRELFIHKVKPHVYVAVHLFKNVWAKKMREEHLDSTDNPCDMDEVCKTPIGQLKTLPYWKALEQLIKDSDNWSTEQRYYYLAKQTCHSANYGITASPFRLNILEKSGGKIVVSKDEAERFLLVYHSLFPEIQDWHQRMHRQVEETRMMYNFFGHPYLLTSYEFLESKWKELYSWVPQSTIATITRVAYTRMQQYIEQNNKKWDMMQDNHDSFLTQFIDSPEEEQEWLKISADCLEQSFVSPVDGIAFTMRSEANTGYNWAPYHKEKNTLGLKEIK